MAELTPNQDNQPDKKMEIGGLLNNEQQFLNINKSKNNDKKFNIYSIKGNNDNSGGRNVLEPNNVNMSKIH